MIGRMREEANDGVVMGKMCLGRDDGEVEGGQKRGICEGVDVSSLP